jgi:hypothetical protein
MVDELAVFPKFFEFVDVAAEFDSGHIICAFTSEKDLVFPTPLLQQGHSSAHHSIQTQFSLNNFASRKKVRALLSVWMMEGQRDHETNEINETNEIGYA